MKKTFLLGVGAQKAGTTWLWEYLRDHPGCTMGHIKEHAVLRAAFAGQRPSGRIAAKVEGLSGALEILQKTPEGKLHPALAAQLLAWMDNIAGEIEPSYYLGTFDRLLKAAPEAWLTGDITPEYGIMDAESLKAARAAIEGAGYEIKVVFLMRDPINRIYSALRMADRNSQGKGQNVGRPASERFKMQYNAAWVEQRTRYEVILAALDAAFEPDQVYLDFFETFFSNESLMRLMDFLGLPYHPADFSYMANASPGGGPLPAEDLAVAREFYEATYSTCADRFGADFIARIWKHY